MSISKSLRKLEKRQMSANTQYVEPLIPGRPAYTTPAGVDVTPDTALRMSAVYACVRLLGDTISSLPLGAYVRRGRNRISYAAAFGEQPVWINKPNPESTRLEFIEQIITSLNLHGNAFILTVRDDMGEIVELYVLHPDDVTIHRNIDGLPLTYLVRNSYTKVSEILTPNDILHIPMFRLPGHLLGLSPIGAARMSVGGAMAAEIYAASYFGNAANPGGVIVSPNELTEEQAKEIVTNWQIDHASPYRAGKVGILSGGADFRPLTINAQDAQMLEARRFGVEEIARLFRVPISLLGHPVAGAMSFASVEAQNLSFVQHSLRPLLERLEQALSTLLPEPDGFVKFNLDALLRGTTLERYEAYTKGLREGFLSLNDVRSVEDLSPIGEAGDQYRVPLQNIDAADARDVGFNLRSEIAARLVQVGYEPSEVLSVVGIEPIKHTGIPSTQLQQVAQIDPADPASVYEVKSERSMPNVDVHAPETIINIPNTEVRVDAPVLNVDAPVLNMEAPQVHMDAPQFTVEIEPNITLQQPSPRKVIRTVERDEHNRIVRIIEEEVEG
jgi:HK97 family phage portal protein